ncbi:MAG: sulfotransferase [Pleurocapsa sp. MO_192.B19]|nr:sulfotransferase [Pleurocapsa sp. MO_192.B19]
MKSIISKFLEKRSYQKYIYQKNKLCSTNNNSSTLLNKFVIFTQPRSGSNLLCGMLNLHPEILCHHEIFNPQRIYYSKDFHELLGNDETIFREDLIKGKVGLTTLKERKRYPEEFIFKIWSNNFGCKAVGFNLFPNHIPYASTSLIRDKNVKKVLLLRRNKIKCYVSLLIARKTGKWDSYNFSKQENNSDISVDVSATKILRWSKKNSHYFHKLRQKMIDMDQSYLELGYEDLIGEKSEYIKSDLLKFIGVSSAVEYLQPPLKKQNSNKLVDLISNFDELKDKLTGTELERYFL